MSFFIRAKKLSFIPQIEIFNPTSNARVILEMEGFV